MLSKGALRAHRLLPGGYGSEPGHGIQHPPAKKRRKDPLGPPDQEPPSGTPRASKEHPPLLFKRILGAPPPPILSGRISNARSRPVCVCGVAFGNSAAVAVVPLVANRFSLRRCGICLRSVGGGNPRSRGGAENRVPLHPSCRVLPAPRYSRRWDDLRGSPPGARAD